jgi:hypothetical protein
VPRRSKKTDLIVLLGYAAISFGYFGWRLLPHPGRLILGLGHDPEISIWSFAWWPHAIGTWTNPFVSHAIYAPSGVNVVWTPSAPGLAVVFSPITSLFGPVVSFNVAALLMPALSAWTAYLLCRYLTRSIWASIVGGYLYGFSTAILRQQLLGHLNLTGVFLIPLVALIILRFLRSELSARGLACRLGLLLACQLWISTEFAFTLTVVLVLGLLLAIWLLRELRPRLRSSVGPIVAGYALGALFAAPLVVYALLGFVSSKFSGDLRTYGGTDLDDFVLPNNVIELGGSSFHSLLSHMPSGDSAYLGVPTLIIVALFAVRSRRLPGSRFVVAALLVSALVALGVTLQIDGHVLTSLPWWDAATHLPGFNNSPPFRFAAYVSLAAAVIVALWIDRTEGRVFARPYLLPVLAVAALVPAVWQSSYPSFYPSHPVRLAFFTDGLYKTCIPQNETVTFPSGSDVLLWQAETGFWFRAADDGLQPFPKYGKPLSSFDTNQFVWDLAFIGFGRPTITRMIAFAATHDVGQVLSVPTGYPDRAQMQEIGPTQLVGGVLVAPGCGSTPLTKRDLTKYVQSAGPEQLSSSRPNIGYCVGLNFNLIPQGVDPAGLLKDAKRAIFVAGQGLTCAAPPPGFKHHGFATPDMSVPADTYPLYSG